MKGALSTGRKFVLGLVIAAVVLLGLFGVCEGLLRLFNYGHAAGFAREVREADGRGWWRENRWVTASYFPPELVRRPQPFRLPKPKPTGTYRIFVLGSSAAMGDPEPAFSLARMLELLLRDAYPSIRFEVVNAGITAINSHVVRAIAADCAKLEPDLFIVYEGNNEVIGPYGPATVFSPFFRSAAAIRAVRVINATRTGQLIAGVARRLGRDREALREWGGMRMFLQHEIERDDPRLAATRDHFRRNLLAIAAAARRAEASTLLCTVLANQKDFPPFLSRHRSTLSPAEKQKWESAFSLAKDAMVAGDDVVAEAKLREALAIDDRPAELHFQLGRLALRQKRPDEARASFQAALDLDVLRFRTDSRLNEVVREVGRAAPNTEVVDLAGDLARQSPDGILGDEFLYEHVHLNFSGTYAVARELLPRVGADLLRRKRIASPPPGREPLSLAEARRRLAYTTYEQAMIIKELRARFSGPPFTQQSGSAARQQLYAERELAATRMLARPETRQGLVSLYEQALAENSDDWILGRNAGMALVALGFAERARGHLERAVAIIPDDADALFALGTAQRQLGDEVAAEKSFATVRALEPNYPGLPVSTGGAVGPPR